VKRKLYRYRQQFYQYQQNEQRLCTYHVCPDTDNTKSHSVNLHVDITLHDHRRMTKIVFDIYVFITSTGSIPLLVDNEWGRIPQDRIRRLIESMPRRVRAVLQANGGHNIY
jgi:hypothetical protein